MERCTPRARFEFIHLMMKHTTVAESEARDAALKLLLYGSTLGRLAEEQCNGYQDWHGNWDEKAEKRSEAKEARIITHATKLCESIGCRLVSLHKADPRGNVLKIVVPDGYTNDWGREGIGVPTS